MDPRKSHIAFYSGLASSLLRCDPLALCTPRILRKDVDVLNRRIDSEGLSFLTKALPKLGKALDKGLIDGRLNVPRGFKIEPGTTSRPAFLQAYFRRVFDEQGVLLEEADPAVVKHIRQVCFFAYKLELPYREEDTAKVVDSFIANESALANLEFEDKAVIDAAAYLVRDVLRDFDPKDIVPRHGPGSVATGERLEQKWTFSRLYDPIHQVYPYYDYFVVGRGRELVDRYKWYKGLRRLSSGTAKVVLVPKDSRGPRLISCEPLEYQWIQQGIMRSLIPHIERHRLTKGCVNFTNQEVNRQLALQSSLTGDMATLDLKDASDLVSLRLVRELFKHVPDTLRAIEAARSAATTLPDGREVILLKHAPMGSALCFPVMALSLWAIITAAVARATRSFAQEVGRSVKVYGDDIIVPVDWTQTSIQALQGVGLRVNTEKSCTQGYFRESCGMDAFKGVVVTPVRLKTLWSDRRSDGNAYVSYIEAANNLLASGYAGTARLLMERLRATYGNIPYGVETAPYPSFRVQDEVEAMALNNAMFRTFWNAHLQRWEYFLPMTNSQKIDSTLTEWNRLLRNVIAGPGDKPDVVVVPRSTKIKRRWTADLTDQL